MLRSVRLVLLCVCVGPSAWAQATTEPAAPRSAAVAGRADGVSAAAREALALTSDPAVARYAEGRAALLALRFDDAQAAFHRLEGEGGPAGAYGLETTALWAAMLAERGPAIDRFYALNDSLAEVAGALPEGATADWLRATAALHRALLLGREERYPRAALSFRDACRRFRRLSSGEAVMPDAHFGQGVCEVAAGSVPRKYRWLTRLVGFSGTVASGLDHLAQAADGDGAQAVEAAAVLAVVSQSYHEGQAGGQERLRRLAAAYPSSPALAYLDGYYHFAERRAVEAEAAFRRAAAALEVPGTAALPTVQAHLGLALFRQDRFAEAAPVLEQFARDARGAALVAQATLHAGLAYELTGDRRRAEALYRRVRSSRDYDSDLAAVRDAERRLAAPMTDAERTLLLGATAFDGGHYEDAVSTLQPLVAGGAAAPVERAEAAYRTGRAFQMLRRWDDALRHFRLATDRPGDPRARWGPWARFHSGEVLVAQGQPAEAREVFQAVLADESEFDYSKALEQRTRAALDRLEAESRSR